MSIVITIVILLSCFKRPILGLALLLQTNIIRSLVEIDYSNPCFNCINESNILLGGIVPVVGFIVILLRLNLVKELKYVVDIFDVFFIATFFVLLVTSFYSPNLIQSLDHTFRFLFLGYTYFIIVKIIVVNAIDYKKYLNNFLIYSLWLAIIFGTFGAILYLQKGFGQGAYRMTIPGVHPIPFSQLLGLGIITSFIIFITNGSFFNIKSKLKLNINKFILPYLSLLLFATNTRGVMLCVAAAVVIYFILARVKIKKRVLYISGSIMLLALIVAVQYIDFEVLFERLLAKKTDKSIDDRFIAYKDSLTIFLNNPFGIGPEAFKHYSVLPYPHNFFLELLSQYGVFGLAISCYFLFLILYMYLTVLKNSKRNLTYVVLLVIFSYFFIETIFSFTLWMHKGMYLALGLFAGYHFKSLKRNSYIAK